MHVKNELRKILKLKRKMIADKNKKDKCISEILIGSDLFINAKTVLFYAATNDEINLDDCIKKSIELGKNVALPLCEDENGTMNFYLIKSFDDLVNGKFGIREPSREICKILDECNNALCIVPGLAYDYAGNRLGYGKGYYDRFLQKFNVISLGVCYNDLVIDKLPTDEFDLPVKFLITEKGFISIN